MVYILVFIVMYLLDKLLNKVIHGEWSTTGGGVIICRILFFLPLCLLVASVASKDGEYTELHRERIEHISEGYKSESLLGGEKPGVTVRTKSGKRVVSDENLEVKFGEYTEPSLVGYAYKAATYEKVLFLRGLFPNTTSKVVVELPDGFVY